MDVSKIIPLVMKLLDLGLDLATIIQNAENVSDTDKKAMKAVITKARDGVRYWDDTGEDDSRYVVEKN